MTTLPQTTPMRGARPGMPLAIPGAIPVLAQPQQPAIGMSGNDVVRVLRANAWLIALLVIFGAASGYAINTWLAVNRPRYTSSGMVRIMTPADFPHIGASAGSGSPVDIDLEAHEQAAKIQHGDLIEHVLTNSTPVRQTRWFAQFVHNVNGSPTVDVDAAKQNLLDNLDITRVPETRLLSISFSSASAKDCQTIVEAVVSQHISDQHDVQQSQEEGQSGLLARVRLEYEEEMRESDSRISKVMKALSDAGKPVDGSGLEELQFQSLVGEQLRADAALADIKQRFEKFQKVVAATNTTPEIEDWINTNGDYVEAKRRVLGMTLELVRDQERQGASNQQVVDLQKLLDMQKQDLLAMHDSLRKEKVQRMQEELSDALLNTQARVAAIDSRVQDLQAKMSDVAALENQYQRLLEEERDTRGKLARLKDAEDDFRNSNPDGENSKISWYTHPELPEIPSFPKLMNTMTMAVGLALALGLGIAFLREATDNSVRSPRDIARVGQLNLLGMIPHQDDDPQAVGARLPLLIMESPHSMVAEQFRQVRTRLQHAASLDTTRSILVTGCSPGDGKTTVACNLAAGLALNGRRILLVDANFRRPELHHIFNLDNHLGFGDVLTNPGAFAEAVHETTVPNLSVLVLGNKPANSTELLESQLLIDFIERALEEYDHVIFDSGPLLIVSETVGLAPRVDGVVTVVRAVGNSRGILQRMRDQLRQLKAEHLGVILNAVRVQGGGYYGPLIKTYYEYQDGPRNRTSGTNGIHRSNGANGVHSSNGANGAHSSNGANGSNGHGSNGNGSNGHGSNGHGSNGNGHGSNGNGSNGNGSNGHI